MADLSSVIRIVLRRLFEALDPGGWWYLMFTLDEENSLKFDVQKKLFSLRRVNSDEGVSIRLKFMPGVDSRDLKVYVEDNKLRCEGIRAVGITHNFEFALPERTYQPSDVKAKMKKGVLLVTITNLTKEDVDDVSQF